VNVTLPHKGKMVIKSICHNDTKTATSTTIVLLRVDIIMVTVAINIMDIMDTTVEAMIMVTTRALSDRTIGHL
jgi:hypothetical protein